MHGGHKRVDGCHGELCFAQHSGFLYLAKYAGQYIAVKTCCRAFKKTRFAHWRNFACCKTCMPQRQNMSIGWTRRSPEARDNKFSLINSGMLALCPVLDPEISRGQSPPKITSFHLLTRERWLSVICWIRRSPEVRALQRKQVFTY